MMFWCRFAALAQSAGLTTQTRPSQHLCFPCTEAAKVFQEHSLQQCSSRLPSHQIRARNRQLLPGIMRFLCRETPASGYPGGHQATRGCWRTCPKRKTSPCPLSCLYNHANDTLKKKGTFKTMAVNMQTDAKLMLQPL